MENQRAIIRILFVLSLLCPVGVFAYEPTTTHDGLTHEAVDFYNIFAPNSDTPTITHAQKVLIQRGAMEEDDNYRMAHHFFDPMYQRGLEFPYAITSYMSSKTWAQSPTYQASWRNGPAGCLAQPQLLFPLYESPCDFSWQRAIYEYVYGNKEYAMLALGHTLHLIEDASVPDHTRNDAHIPIFDNAIKMYDDGFAQKSPFEEYTNQFSLENKNIHTTAQLIKENAVPYKYSSLDTFFDNAASYSNMNFFSKSTIFSPEYQLPTITSHKDVTINGEIHKFGFYEQHFLVEKISKIDEETLEKRIEYIITDDEKIILNDYWQLTSRDAVKNAAGVIGLFFEEVEKEKQTGALQKGKGALVQQASTKVVWGIAITGEKGARGVTKSIAWIDGVGASTARYIAVGMKESATQLALLRLGAPSAIARAPLPAPTISTPSNTTVAVANPAVSVISAPISTSRNPLDVLAELIEKLTRAR